MLRLVRRSDPSSIRLRGVRQSLGQSPAHLHAQADVACAGCGVRVGSWSEFNERARQVILSEIASGKVSADLDNSDILITDLAQTVR
jgi:hypothetical protein